jgi:uncharacterized protein (DUF1015 family)
MLIPKGVYMPSWSVVACDQYSSQIEYWDEADKNVGVLPSTLRLMLPEAYLNIKDTEFEAKKANEIMHKYINEGVFKIIENSFIYTERTLSCGKVRKGLLGVLDLEYYDYGKNSISPIHATEGTIEDRLPPRVGIRKDAPLEMPHIMVFIDDPDFAVIEPVSEMKQKLSKLYDFELMAQGGHIAGWQVSSDNSDVILKALDNLIEPETIKRKYGKEIENPVIYAIGDGNHSLATAKLCWEQLKPNLSDDEIENHPARYSLVELVNIHDDAIVFEPIHRAIFETDSADFVSGAEEFWKSKSKTQGNAHKIRYITEEEHKDIEVKGLTIGELIAGNDEFLQTYIKKYGGKIDYIHGDMTCTQMACGENCAGVLLPKMKKTELFTSVMSSGVFPRKSFSIGHAEDKRYYLECRKIK